MMGEFAAPSPSVSLSATMTRMDRNLRPRSAHRFKIFQPGFWSAAGTTVPIHLLDISTSGALAYAEAPPRLGDYVLIECGLPLGKARVTWRDGNKFGVCFIVALGSDTLDAVAGMKLRHDHAAR